MPNRPSGSPDYDALNDAFDDFLDEGSSEGDALNDAFDDFLAGPEEPEVLAPPIEPEVLPPAPRPSSLPPQPPVRTLDADFSASTPDPSSPPFPHYGPDPSSPPIDFWGSGPDIFPSDPPPPPRPSSRPSDWVEPAEETPERSVFMNRRRFGQVLGGGIVAGSLGAHFYGLVPGTEKEEEKVADDELLRRARKWHAEKNAPVKSEAEKQEEDKGVMEKAGEFIEDMFGDGKEYKNPKPFELDAAAQERLDKQVENKKYGPYYSDEKTGNYILEKLRRQAIDEELVQENIHGTEIVAKRSVMERLKYAALELEHGPYNIRLFCEGRSHFRRNQDQYDLDAKYDIVGSVAGSYHLLGQAFDFQNAGVETKEAQEIRKVLKKYGFRWGVKTDKKKNLWKKFTTAGKDLFSRGLSMEAVDAVVRSGGVEDRVHFDMPKDQLEATQKTFEQLKEAMDKKLENKR